MKFQHEEQIMFAHSSISLRHQSTQDLIQKSRLISTTFLLDFSSFLIFSAAL